MLIFNTEEFCKKIMKCCVFKKIIRKHGNIVLIIGTRNAIIILGIKKMTFSEYELSVIIPVHNTEKYLYRCIESITNQTYKNLQIILIDDESTDSSFSICKEFENKDPRVSVFSNNGKGVSSARNFGMSKAKGEYITFVDSDDYLELNAYEKALNNIGNCDAIFFGYYDVYEKSNFIKFNKPTCTGIKDSYETIYNCMFPINNGYCATVWNKIFKKDKVKNIYFDESFTVGEDEEWLVRVILNLSNIMLYNEPLYYYVQRSDSTFNSFEKLIFNWESRLKTKERVIQLVSDNKELYDSVITKEYNDLFDLVVKLYVAGNYRESQIVYKRINKYKKQFIQSGELRARRKIRFYLTYLFMKIKMPKNMVMKIWNLTTYRINLFIKEGKSINM